VLSIGLVLRLLLGSVFLVAAADKFGPNGVHLQRTVLGYDLLSPRLARWLAAALPPVETVCGLLLLSGFCSEFAVAAAIALLGLFTLALTVSVMRGHAHPCGCAQSLEPIRWRMVLRNLCLIAVAVTLWLVGPGALPLSEPPDSDSLNSAISMGTVAVPLAMVWLRHTRAARASTGLG